MALGNPDRPFFSPDGAWVGFVPFLDVRTLRKVSVSGGQPETVAESPSNILGASWGSDNDIIFGTQFGTDDRGLFRVSVEAGEPQALTTLDTEQGETSHTWPFIIPGREAVLFVVSTADVLTSGQLAVLDLETGEIARLGIDGFSPRYVSTGHLVYGAEGGSVRAVPFDTTTLAVAGVSIPVVEEVTVSYSGAANFDASDSGQLVYASVRSPLAASRSLMRIDREGTAEPLAGLSNGRYMSVDVSPDGTRLALEIRRDSQVTSDLWIHDLRRGTLAPLTSASGIRPLWSPSGRQVVFASRRGGFFGLYRRNADGTGDAERLHADETSRTLNVSTWGADGETLIFVRRDQVRRNDLMVLSVGDEDSAGLLLESEFNETRAVVSPNGRWIAYESDRSGRYEVYVERFPELGNREFISTDGGVQPRWSADGEELFYLDLQANRLMSVAVTGEPDLAVGRPRVISDGRFFSYRGNSAYDVTPDGSFVIRLLSRICGRLKAGHLSK